MRAKKGNALEIDLDVTAQQLLAPLGTSDVLELDDIVDIAIPGDSELPSPSNADDALQETSEIELTAEQMSAMLEGRWP